ncbi:peptidase inhibitor 16-like [Salvelinus fontinalis]|uniref:peptidase inhibitor 16-like n=1 Tax=Salvelinus fontinalis TaxID=8038 RepID=UPI0024866E06|nr:peptidase inhibitor 16-like [Salvelinus fontinalis]
MLRGTLLWAGLVGFYVIVTLCPASCQLSEDDTETLVELHNSYRGQVVPNSTYMQKVKWDEKLKIIAEGYAVKCIWEHNPDLEELNMGENLFVSNGLFDPNIAMEKWFLEHLDYDYNNNSCQDDKMCGHYTQMVWADSHSVGCAVHRCDTMEGLSFDKATFLVCNYYPAGNFNDEKPYEEGEWCSKCPDNLPRCDQNLCVPDAHEPTEEPDVETMYSSLPGTDEPSTHTATATATTTATATATATTIATATATATTIATATATATTIATATEDTPASPPRTQPDYSSAPEPTMADREETGTEPGDEEEEWEGEGEERATEREKDSTREQPPSNAGSVSTSLLLVTSLMPLLSLGL